MPRVVYFEIPADDPEKSQQFYSAVFGWQFQKWDGPMPYWMILTGTESIGVDGGMMKRQDLSQPVTNVIDVPSVDVYVQKVEAAGGQIVLPKMAIPGIGWLAYFKDLDGYIFGMMESDPAAA